MRLYRKIMLLLLFFPVSLNAQEKAVVSIAELDSIMKTEPRPVVILLTTEWCTYCKMQKSLLLKAKQNTDKIYFTEFDAETKEAVTFNGKIYTYKPTGIDTGVNELAIILANRGDSTLAYPAWVILDKNYKPVYVYQGVLHIYFLHTPRSRHGIFVPNPFHHPSGPHIRNVLQRKISCFQDALYSIY